MARKISLFTTIEAFLASVLVHAMLFGLIILSSNWHGFWWNQDEAKAGSYSPLEGFTVVLAPSDAKHYTENSESIAAKEEELATQTQEAQNTGLVPEVEDKSTVMPETGVGSEMQKTELPKNAKSAQIDSAEHLVSGSPDSKKADGSDNDLLNQYFAAFRKNLALRWQGSPLQNKAECRLLVSQLELGQLVDVVFLDCPVSAEARQQIVQALDKSVALPYQGYERVIRNPMEVTICFPELVGC